MVDPSRYGPRGGGPSAPDDLQGACDAALSRRDAPDDLAPAYDTFLAAMTSLLELVGG